MVATGDLFIARFKYITIPDTERCWVLLYNPCSAPVWPLEGIKAKIKAPSIKAMTRVTLETYE